MGDYKLGERNLERGTISLGHKDDTEYSSKVDFIEDCGCDAKLEKVEDIINDIVAKEDMLFWYGDTVEYKGKFYVVRYRLDLLKPEELKHHVRSYMEEE